MRQLTTQRCGNGRSKSCTSTRHAGADSRPGRPPGGECNGNGREPHQHRVTTRDLPSAGYSTRNGKCSGRAPHRARSTEVLSRTESKTSPPLSPSGSGKTGSERSGGGGGAAPMEPHVTTWRAHALGPWGSCYRAALRPVGCCGRAEGRPGSSQGHSIKLSQVKTPYPGTRRWASRR
jgi:hypothetical protein